MHDEMFLQSFQFIVHLGTNLLCIILQSSVFCDTSDGLVLSVTSMVMYIMGIHLCSQDFVENEFSWEVEWNSNCMRSARYQFNVNADLFFTALEAHKVNS